jgi:hypothetical protein
MKGGSFLNHWRMAQLHAQEAPDRVRELEQWGALFDRTRDGRILQRAFGGHTYKRLAHVGDRTGLEMIRTLQDRAVQLPNLKVYMECTITSLLKDGDRVAGAFGYWRTDGRFVRFDAGAVVLATGGIGKSFRVTSNSWEYTADGQSLALGGRRRADRPRVRAVPPDGHGVAAGRHGPARHRGRARRGRHPAQQPRRPVHVEVPARGAARTSTRRTRPRRGAGSRPPSRRSRPAIAGRPSCRRATTSRARSTPR